MVSTIMKVEVVGFCCVLILMGNKDKDYLGICMLNSKVMI